MSSIAVVNAGSSSIKFAIFDAAEHPSLRLRGQVEGIGATPRAKLTDAAGAIVAQEEPEPTGFDHVAATQTMMRVAGPFLEGHDIVAMGHRVVHGGSDFAEPALINDEILERLAALIPLAPLHQPHNLAVIRAMRTLRPRLPQVACFDTAFHRSQPPIAQAFALPRNYSDAGVRRYGFHGVSYQYVIGKLRGDCAGTGAGTRDRRASRQWRQPLRDP